MLPEAHKYRTDPSVGRSRVRERGTSAAMPPPTEAGTIYFVCTYHLPFLYYLIWSDMYVIFPLPDIT
jgi:hypothetical protein